MLNHQGRHAHGSGERAQGFGHFGCLFAVTHGGRQLFFPWRLDRAKRCSTNSAFDERLAGHGYNARSGLPEQHAQPFNGFLGLGIAPCHIEDSFGQRLEQDTYLVWNRNLERVFDARNAHKPIAVLNFRRHLAVVFVVLHHQGIRQGSGHQHDTAHFYLTLDFQTLRERHVAFERTIQNIQALNLRVKERNHCAQHLDTWRQPTAAKVLRLKRTELSLRFGQTFLQRVFVDGSAGSRVSLKRHGI